MRKGKGLDAQGWTRLRKLAEPAGFARVVLAVCPFSEALLARPWMGLCGCCTKDEGEVFKPNRKRWCTDVLCLIFLSLASGLMLAIGYACVSAHPGLIDGLIYPKDGYGNYCGKPGTATENMPKVFYPDLDNDMIKHSDKLAKQPPQR